MARTGTRPENLGSTVRLDLIEAAAREATPGPWGYTSNCGASVIVGIVHDQEPGSVRLKKGGFFLFEIDPSAYDEDARDEDELEAQAYADAKFIGMTGPDVVLAMVEEIRRLRSALEGLIPF